MAHRDSDSGSNSQQPPLRTERRRTRLETRMGRGTRNGGENSWKNMEVWNLTTRAASRGIILPWVYIPPVLTRISFSPSLLTSNLAERTFLAWLRTSLAFASIGIAVTQLFRLNTTIKSSEGFTPAPDTSGTIRLRQVGKPLGATFLGIAILVLGVGGRRYFESQVSFDVRYTRSLASRLMGRMTLFSSPAESTRI